MASLNIEWRNDIFAVLVNGVRFEAHINGRQPAPSNTPVEVLVRTKTIRFEPNTYEVMSGRAEDFFWDSHLDQPVVGWRQITEDELSSYEADALMPQDHAADIHAAGVAHFEELVKQGDGFAAQAKPELHHGVAHQGQDFTRMVPRRLPDGKFAKKVDGTPQTETVLAEVVHENTLGPGTDQIPAREHPYVAIDKDGTVTPIEGRHPGLQLNPKDAIGRAKVPFSTIPGPVLAEIALALGEGARKYGRHNWRKADIYASVYYDGALRHLVSWWEGEDIDPDSGVSHITKAIAGLIIARDAMMTGRMRDDRPPFTHDQSFMFDMNRAMGEIVDKYPDPVAPFTRQSS